MSSKFITEAFLVLFLITVSTTVFAVNTMDLVIEEELIEENLVEELENETIENTTLVIEQTLDNNTLDKINQTINFVFENCLADDYGFSRAKNSGSNLGVTYQALVVFSSLDKQITNNSSIRKYLDSGKPVTYIKNTLPKILQDWDYTYALGILTFLNIGPEYQGINFLDKIKKIFNIKLNDEYIWDEVSLINILSYYKDSDKESKEIIKKAVALLKSTINKKGLWGYSVKGEFSDSDMTALVIYSLINSGEVPIDDPLLKEAYDNIIKNFYINGSGIRSPALANSPANSVTTATTLRAAYYLNNKSLDITDQAINDSMSFIETMRDPDGGYRLSQDNKESDCLTTLSILPIISFEAYSEPKPHNITHDKYSVTKIDVETKEYKEKNFKELNLTIDYINQTMIEDDQYILLKNYNMTK